MTNKERYNDARARYAALGIDTDKAMEKAAAIPVSMHCWQGDDVQGFDARGPLTGGIQTTGSYPYRAQTPEQLMQDMDKVLSYVPGAHRINLHASYAFFGDDGWVDRDALKPEHFVPWAAWARERGLGIDFNPTLFSHPKADARAGTLSAADDEIRHFWIRHCIACLKIAEYFAGETGTPCLLNLWIPDGSKDIPGSRTRARARLKDSLDEIIRTPYDRNKVCISVESKFFGIGVESMTVGSHEFYMNYADKNDLLCLIDTGHFHPTEVVADKLSSLLLFHDKLALHVSRPVRWDSDHVVLFNDDLRDLATEIVRTGPEHYFIGMDYFDASINRVSAWTNGLRSMQKALLYAELLPNDVMADMQDAGNYTALMSLNEQMKVMPFGDIWDAYCEKTGVPLEKDWFADCLAYEKDVLSKRV